MSKVRWPTEAELQQLELVVKDLDVERTKLWWDHPGPWLNLDVWVHLEGERKFALWRSTGAVYPIINELGEAGEDAIIPEAWDARDCPYCGNRVYSTQAEIAHMNEKHPDIIRERLRDL
jgi:hypothetical protein